MFCLNSFAQRNFQKLYQFIDVDSGKYESIYMVQVTDILDSSMVESISFRHVTEKESGGAVGVYADQLGYFYLNPHTDTFFVLFELKNYFDTAFYMHCDTVRHIGKGIVFSNPFPDFYLNVSGNCDPLLTIFFYECAKTDKTCGTACGYTYTREWYLMEREHGCIRNDSNGTLYQYCDYNGDVYARGYFKEGLPNGIWYLYGSEGRITNTYHFRCGEIVDEY